VPPGCSFHPTHPVLRIRNYLVNECRYLDSRGGNRRCYTDRSLFPRKRSSCTHPAARALPHLPPEPGQLQLYWKKSAQLKQPQPS